jgi:hypothetical protein
VKLLDDLNRIKRKIQALEKEPDGDCYVSLFRKKIARMETRKVESEMMFGNSFMAVEHIKPDTNIEFKFSGGTIYRIIHIMLEDLRKEEIIIQNLIKKQYEIIINSSSI